MVALLAKLGKWILKIPVLFAHFPGSSFMLVGIIAIAAGSLSSCLTHQLEVGARAELAVELADEKAATAKLRADAAEKRTAVIESASREQRAIDAENNRAWRQQFAALAESMNDKDAIAGLNRAIKELHNDPAFACRRQPLPDSFLDGMRFPAETPGAAANDAGSDSSRAPARRPVPPRDPRLRSRQRNVE